jgi:hypothetical protein
LQRPIDFEYFNYFNIWNKQQPLSPGLRNSSLEFVVTPHSSHDQHISPIMPPYSSPFSATTHGDGDLSRSYTTTGRGASTSLGFTSNLMETIAASKSKMEEWARHEKAKADAMAEAYHQHLSQEQAVIDAKSTELLAVQMERGRKLDANDEEASQSTADNIASRKQALEEKASAVQIEIMKLKTEKENRTERVKGKKSQQW